MAGVEAEGLECWRGVSVMMVWEMPEGGVAGGPGRGVEEQRCCSEAIEPFLEIWGLPHTGGSAMVEEGSG